MSRKKAKRQTSKKKLRILPSMFATMFGIAVIAIAGMWFSTYTPEAEAADIVVYKRANCSCCIDWMAQLMESGLSVEVRDLAGTASVQSRLGVPDELRSCHTAEVGDYWVEGHVPIDLVTDLLRNQPENIEGLAVNGMPIGSPGMEGPGAETFEVMRLNSDGSVEVHAKRAGAESPPSQ